MNTSKRGGKAAFYRIGFIDGQIGMPIRSSRTVRLPLWAKEAFWNGWDHGAQQRRIARCVHEPLMYRNRRETAICAHCCMKLRALRRGKA